MSKFTIIYQIITFEQLKPGSSGTSCLKNDNKITTIGIKIVAGEFCVHPINPLTLAALGTG